MEFRPFFTPLAASMSVVALLLTQSLGCRSSSPDRPASEASFAESTPSTTSALSSGEPPPGSSERCDEPMLISVAEEMFLQAGGSDPAAEALRQSCAGEHGVQGCSCAALRNYLTTSTLVQARLTQCCASSELCARDGLCQPANPAGERWLEELQMAVKVTRSLGQLELVCESPALCEAAASVCAQTVGCTYSGRCGVDDEGQCAATRVEHCRESGGCIESGRCSLSPSGAGCVIASEEDCARSERCRVDGQCAYSDAFGCEAATEAHCLNSAGCREQGRCSLSAAPEDLTSDKRGRICFSASNLAVKQARVALSDALARASLVPLREGLARVKTGEAELEAFPTYSPRQVHPDLPSTERRRYIVAVVIEPDHEATYVVPCEEYLALQRELIPPTRWRREGFVLEAQAQRLSAGDQVLIDRSAEYCSGESSSGWRTTSLESWVGPVVTLHEYSEFTDNEYELAQNSWRTLDLHHGEPASLTRLVEEASLVEAFKDDVWVSDQIASFLQIAERRLAEGRISRSELDEARRWVADFEAEDSLVELLTLFNERLRGSAFIALNPQQVPYGFAYFDAARGQVALRLAIARLAGPGLTDFITLGLMVDIRPEYREAFQRADDEGWLIGGEQTPLELDLHERELE